ncbi:MAG TPA: hypothetical protein VG454_07100 [Gemmatimonadales bacterium]|nr:hypothetical protein [Gemmatimonadales bacterium]
MTFRSLPGAALSLAAACVTACANPTASSSAPPPPPAAVMLGEWRHTSASAAAPPSLNTGLSVSITIDSARDVRFWGRVTLWFAGDVGIPASRFGPVTGSVDSARAVLLQIEVKQAAALRLEGEISQDRLTVHASWKGSEPGPFPQGCTFQRLH